MRLPTTANDNRTPTQIREAAGKRAYLHAEFENTGLVSQDWQSLNTVERRRWVEMATSVSGSGG